MFGKVVLSASALISGIMSSAIERRYAGPTMEEIQNRAWRKTRMRSNGSWKPPTAESREAQRRARRMIHLHQHPSVIARFAQHPTKAQIDAAEALIQSVTTGEPMPALAAPSIDPNIDLGRKLDGETKSQRDARIKREKRALLKAAA